MNQYRESTVQRVNYASRKVIISFFIIFILSTLSGFLTQILKIRWEWLEILGGVSFFIEALLLAIGMITPGILIVLGAPWYAQAWLRGIGSPFLFLSKSWEHLSGFQKNLVYYLALSSSGFGLLAIIAFVIPFLRR